MYVVNITLQMLKPSRLIGEHLLLMHLLVLSATFAIFSAGDRTAFGEDVVEFSPAQLEFFEKQVRPILVKRCYK
ncbi:MAG: hypothetical protein ACI9HK_003936, partial [Pirellulaceae bacterium]